MAEELAFKDEAAAEHDRAFAHVIAHFMPFLLRAAHIAPGMHVLDIATGTGLSAEAALAAVGPIGYVMAADVSPAMAEKARERLGKTPNASVSVEDGQALSFADCSFDAVLCNLGLMFFPEPVRGLSEFRRVLRPGGRVAVSVNTVVERSYNHQINVIIARHMPSLAEAVTRTFALGEASRLRSLFAMLLFRIIQGLAGGGMVPVAQSILADYFPPEKRGQAFALYGIAMVVAPVVGPTLGGWLADNITWRWAFLINGPVGLFTIALIALLFREPKAAAAGRRRPRQQGGGFDLLGFILDSTFLGALEIVLDRALIDDWFASSFIVDVAAVCALAFVLMIPWEISRRNPMIDLRMVATRQFGACFVAMLATGAVLYGTTQYLPRLVQEDFGYTATWAGLVLAPGGLVTMVMFAVVGRLSAKVQAKYLIMIGAVFAALAMYVLTNVYGNLSFWFFAQSRIWLGIGLPLLFTPITAASYDGLPPGKTDQASALLNAARNTGGSIGISLVSNALWDREQFHQNMLAGQAVPSSIAYQDTLHQVTNYFVAQGSSLVQAHQQAIQWIGRQVQTQASFLGYMDAFWMLMLISLAIVPLALILRKVKLGGAAPVGH